jgi:hypothetical protein
MFSFECVACDSIRENVRGHFLGIVFGVPSVSAQVGTRAFLRGFRKKVQWIRFFGRVFGCHRKSRLDLYWKKTFS